MSSAETAWFVFVATSIAAGLCTGWFARRVRSFIVSIAALPLAIATALYWVELYQLLRIGHSSGESWVGLVVPLFSAGSFALALPSALLLVGVRRVLKRRRERSKPDRP